MQHHEEVARNCEAIAEWCDTQASLDYANAGLYSSQAAANRRAARCIRELLKALWGICA